MKIWSRVMAAWAWLALLGGLGLCLAWPAWADPPGRVGRVADVQGAAWLHDADDGQWRELVPNQPLTGGDRLRTDAGARVVLHVGSATLRVGGGSEVEWLRLDDEALRLALVAGRLGVRLRSDEVAQAFEVVLPQARLLPLRAGHYRVDRVGDASTAEALAGDLLVDAPDLRRRVDAGQRVVVFRRLGPAPATVVEAIDAPADDFGRWLLAQEAAEPPAPAIAQTVSPEMTGWQDLDRHGRWDRHPEYGPVWMPLAVAPGWAPYRVGRWVWVRPWGWTWVDAAPWGFAPFHYGRWLWWGGRWAWWPGTYAPRPVYSPALVGWIAPPGVSVSIGVGPWIGWVPLAPRDVYRPWYPVSPRHPYPRPLPGGAPGPYAHLDVPGGVTAVSPDVLTGRRPIGTGDLRPLDPRELRRVAALPVGGAPPAWPAAQSTGAAPAARERVPWRPPDPAVGAPVPADPLPPRAGIPGTLPPSMPPPPTRRGEAGTMPVPPPGIVMGPSGTMGPSGPMGPGARMGPGAAPVPPRDPVPSRERVPSRPSPDDPRSRQSAL
jgi:hypothetical protein